MQLFFFFFFFFKLLFAAKFVAQTFLSFLSFLKFFCTFKEHMTILHRDLNQVISKVSWYNWIISEVP